MSAREMAAPGEPVAPFNPAAPLAWEMVTRDAAFPTLFSTAEDIWFKPAPSPSRKASLIDGDGDPYFTFEWPNTAGDLVDLIERAYRNGMGQGESIGRERLKYEMRQLLGALAAEP